MLIKTLFHGDWPKAVLFDLDGTLVDSALDLHQAVVQMLADLGYFDVELLPVQSWIGNGSLKLVERALSHFKRDTNEGVEPERLQQAHELFLDHYQATRYQTTRLYSHVTELLDKLKSVGVKLAIITNKPSQFTPDLLRQLKIDQYFDLCLCGDSLPEKKPSSLPLIYAAEQMHVGIHESLMVGDSINDIAAATACSMKSVAVSYGYHQSDDVNAMGANAVISDLIELISFQAVN